MTLPFKPHIIALACSAGLFVGAGVLYVNSRTPEAPSQPAPAAAPQPTVAAAPAVAPVAPTTYTTAQLDQWVAPVALYPDPLLSQVLMASTYPSNVVQAVQWSRDNPTLQGDAAIQAVSGQSWDPSVKSLVAFPQLMALMGENPDWVQNLGNAFLAQPQDVMDAVQRLRLLAQQTGSLKSTPQQTVTNTQKTTVIQTPSSSTTKVTSSAPTSTVIKIEPTDPQVVYVPNYNPTVVYGSWPNTAYPLSICRPLRASSLPIASSKVSAIAWALRRRMHCSVTSTGMTTTITMMMTIMTMTPLTAVMATSTTEITSILMLTISTIYPDKTLKGKTLPGSTTLRTVTACLTRTTRSHNVFIRPTLAGD